jgi:acyl-CoA synthetase (NDP forming)
VVFGLGGVAAGVLGDRAARLTPLTDADAAELVRTGATGALLSGRRGTAPVDTAALADLLLRVSRLADDLPEVAELKLAVAATPGGAEAGDARIRVSPARPRDPFLRQLR